jgi:hypothetical protein
MLWIEGEDVTIRSRLSLIALAATLVAVSAGALLAHSQAAAGNPRDPRTLIVGNWKLAKYESFDETGNPVARGGYDAGRIMYDDKGNMAAQLSRNGRPRVTRESTAQERLAASAGFLAYFGTYTIDLEKGMVTHHVKGSTNTAWPGTDLVRYYTFSEDGNQLVLSLKNAAGRVTGKLTWERLR